MLIRRGIPISDQQWAISNSSLLVSADGAVHGAPGFGGEGGVAQEGEGVAAGGGDVSGGQGPPRPVAVMVARVQDAGRAGAQALGDGNSPPGVSGLRDLQNRVRLKLDLCKS